MLKRIGTIWMLVALALAVVFAVGSLAGWFLPDSAKLQLVTSVLTKFEMILANSSTDWHLAWNIFLNNLVVAAIVLVSAIIPVVPIIILFVNGMLIGVFADLLHRFDYLQAGTLYSAAISLIPHGIFELSAIFLAGSLGIVAFVKIVAPGKVQSHLSRQQFLLVTLKWFALAVVPLLIVAAIIEAFISPRVAEMLLQDRSAQMDSPQAVQLDPLALAQTNCIPGEATNLASVTSDQISLLYDAEVTTLLRERAQVTQWQVTYSCPKGGWFTVASFASNAWSTEQATALVLAMLQHLEANYTQPNSATIDTKISDLKVRYQFESLGNNTVVVTQADLDFNPADLLVR